MGKAIALVVVLAFGLATPVFAKAPLPDLKSCPQVTRAEDEPELLRTRPLPLPASFEGLAAADIDYIAVLASAGSTLCLDTRFIEEIAKARASPDGRFLSFEWSGYEAWGYVLFDRSGRGMTLDTGNAPLASSTGKRFAAVDLSESGYGALNAFGVWQIEPVGVLQLAKFDTAMPSGDWQLDNWRGDTCVNLSVVPIDRHPEDFRQLANIRRDPWFAAESRKWQPRPGRCPAA